MKCLFMIQGEGRGHLTQALALRTVLRRAGHAVPAVVVGQNRQRALPSFFEEGIGAPIHRLPSPSFVADAARRGVRPGATLWNALRHLPHLAERLDMLEHLVEQTRPDVVVNFFEPLAGLYYGLRRPEPPMVSIGHQYMFLHPAYEFPSGWPVSQRAARAFARITAWGAAQRIALSLYPAPACPEQQLTVHPPLLRAAVLSEPVRTESFVLLYLLNRGYIDEVRDWHDRHPDVPLHCFVQRPDAPTQERLDDTLVLHQLDGPRFVSMMARCGGMVSTAGFESVAEARYMGKPVQVVPVAGHFEQHCNAHDIARAGAGCWTPRFNLDPMRDMMAASFGPDPSFREWVDAGHRRWVGVIEAAAYRGAGAGAHPAYSAPDDDDGIGAYESAL